MASCKAPYETEWQLAQKWQFGQYWQDSQTVSQEEPVTVWQDEWDTDIHGLTLCCPGDFGDSGDNIHHYHDTVFVISHHEGEHEARTCPPAQCGRSQERRTWKIDPDSSIPSRIQSGYSIPEVSLSISICQSSSLCVCTLYLHLCLQP